jgi:LIVCS family branched-chain amino acid:cation transporter
MTRSKMIFTTGLAMFAMFFGSGNLVFPLNLGVISGEDYIVSVLGFMLTGVFMPFVGLLSVMLYNGSRSKFFGLLGKKILLLITMAILLLLGPFGVIPRCVVVAYGAMAALISKFFSIHYSVLFFPL